MSKVKSKEPTRNLYAACQKVLNESLASALRVPLNDLSNAGNVAVAEYLSKEIKTYTVKEHAIKSYEEGKTNDTLPLSLQTFNLDDIEIHEMKPKKISYRCEQCDYSTSFFCSYQIHLDSCSSRGVNNQENGIIMKNTIALTEEVKAILYDRIKDIDVQSFKSLIDLDKFGDENADCQEDTGSESDCQIIEDEVLDSKASSSETSNINQLTDIQIKNENDLTNDCSNNIQECKLEQIDISDILIKDGSVYNGDYEMLEQDRDTTELYTEMDIIEDMKEEYIDSTNQFIEVIKNQFIEEHITEENDIVQYEDMNCLIKDSQTLDIRLTGRHFPDYLSCSSGGEFKMDNCIVCFSKTINKKMKIRKKTKYYCKVCDVSLCAVPCFGIYHTEVHF